MPIPILTEDSALKTHWASVTYTEARLRGDDNAKEHAPIFTGLRERAQSVGKGQQDTWRDELVAQALVNEADDALDDWVQELARTLRHLLARKTDSPRYRRTFSNAPSTIIRLGLRNEMDRVRGWGESLLSEPESTNMKRLLILAVLVLSAGCASAFAERDPCHQGEVTE